MRQSLFRHSWESRNQGFITFFWTPAFGGWRLEGLCDTLSYSADEKSHDPERGPGFPG
jgi:hypothetical protein